MSKINLEFNRLFNAVVEAGWKLKPEVWVPASGAAIDAQAPPLQIMAPAGAVNVLLPVSNAANQGLMFFLVNNSGNAITMQSSGGAGFTTAIVLAANESTLVVCTGNATAALGWQAIGTASSA